MHINNNLGIAEELFSAAASAFLSPDGGGGSSLPLTTGGGSRVTVSPAIQTQVSPQISPVFQQAFQPTGSPMTAGTQQLAPSTQSNYPGTGEGVPGGPILPGAGTPFLPSGLTPLDFTKVNQQVTPDYTKWGLIALAGAGLVFILTNKKRGVTKKTTINKKFTRKIKRRKSRVK